MKTSEQCLVLCSISQTKFRILFHQKPSAQNKKWKKKQISKKEKSWRNSKNIRPKRIEKRPKMLRKMEWSQCKRCDEVGYTNVFTRIFIWQKEQERVSITRHPSISLVLTMWLECKHTRALFTSRSLCRQVCALSEYIFVYKMWLCVWVCSVFAWRCFVCRVLVAVWAKRSLHSTKRSCNDFSSGVKCWPNMHERYYVTT